MAIGENKQFMRPL